MLFIEIFKNYLISSSNNEMLKKTTIFKKIVADKAVTGRYKHNHLEDDLINLR